MMKDLFTWWQFVLIGMCVATALWCVIIFLIGVWAGWPRARERDAWRAAEEARADYEMLQTVVARAVLRLDADYAAEQHDADP